MQITQKTDYHIKIFDGKIDSKKVIFTSQKAKQKIILKKKLENLIKQKQIIVVHLEK